MCHQRTGRHSLFCVLPPYMLSSIAQNGSAKERAAAIQTISADQTFRIQRVEESFMASREPRPMTLGTEEGVMRRTIYDAGRYQQLPGKRVRVEGSAPSKDVAVNEAYDGLGTTFDFYWNVYERNSIDDAGMALNATVHYGRNYDNAFWNGSWMVFGDGDGRLFNRFTIALDVIGHELTHGVTQYDAQLRYSNQAGALNESISDVFGSLIKQYSLQQTADQADWLIGAGLLSSSVNGVALRSMQAPGTAYDDPVLGKDPQPAHMDDFVRTHEDNGGVHINSGIPNRAFYLASTAIGGYAWEKAGRIWYEALRAPHLRQTSGFRVFARLTVTAARQLYGSSSSEQQAVLEAWRQVGVTVSLPPR